MTARQAPPAPRAPRQPESPEWVLKYESYYPLMGLGLREKGNPKRYGPEADVKLTFCGESLLQSDRRYFDRESASAAHPSDPGRRYMRQSLPPAFRDVAIARLAQSERDSSRITHRAPGAHRSVRDRDPHLHSLPPRLRGSAPR